MMDLTNENESALQRLAELGMSEAGVLRSTGVEGHRKRLADGALDGARLARYAEDLSRLDATARAAGTAITVDFWDVQSGVMRAAGIDEYGMAHKLSQPEYGPYVALLARCYGRLRDFKRTPAPGQTAVGTALSILQEVAGTVREGHTVEMTHTLPHLNATQRAIFLWQQILTGTNRQVPYLGRDAYTHSYWGRFNVIEMWRYENHADVSVDDVWGLSGFDDYFIRDPHNTNQIEHMAITALAQMVLRLPATFLNALEELEWLLRKCSRIESEADKALNRAVAREFRPLFRLEDPQPACDSLERVLAGPPPNPLLHKEGG